MRHGLGTFRQIDMLARCRDYYARGQIITTNTYADVRAIMKMMPLNPSAVIYRGFS